METKRLSYLEVTLAIAQLSPEDRQKLRENFDLIESFSRPEVMEEITSNNRAATAGETRTPEQVAALLERSSHGVA